MIELVQEDEDYLRSLGPKLDQKMAVVFSNFYAGEDNAISGDMCPPETVSYSGPVSHMSNFAFASNNSFVEEDPVDDTIVFGDVCLNVDD